MKQLGGAARQSLVRRYEAFFFIIGLVNPCCCNLRRALPPLTDCDPYEDGVFRRLEGLVAGSRNSSVRAREYKRLRGDGRINSV